MKYTKGKWNVFFNTDDDETEFGITANGTVICISGERNNEVNFANANLIASAPEMLEALKNAEGVVRLASPSMAGKIKELVDKAEGK